MATLGASGPVWNFKGSFRNVFMKTFMYGIVGSLAMFITSWEKSDRMKDQFLNKNRDYGEVFDFVIIGGGTAGSIVANRLSMHYKVLLLEAGGEPHPFQSIPFLTNFMNNYKELDWMHTSVSQPHAFFGSVDNKARISQGMSLGGTSNLDYMMYLRGNPKDYDSWANNISDPSWGYENLMPYFKKHEDYDGPWNNKKMHGERGEMRISLPKYTSGIAKRFVKSGMEMGYEHLDLNGEYSEGFDMVSYPTNRGYRQGAYKSFLQRAGPDRWNLVIHKYAHVNKILTRGENNEAFGVEYDHHGQRQLAYAKKEVILSAGAINTPKLLLLSGIGSTFDLQALGIPTKVHLPNVGQNLQDHLGVILGPFFTQPGTSLLLDRDLTVPSFLNYAVNDGPLTTTGYEAVGMLTSESAKLKGHPHWPDIQLTLNCMALHSTSDEDFAHAHRFKKDIISKYYKNAKGVDSFSIIVSASRPQSRGEVKLADRYPYTPAIINPRYFEKIEDVGVMIDGIKKAMRLVENTQSLREIGAHFTNESVRGCEGYKFKSDEYWSCYVRLFTVSMGDIAGTAAMGKVVDSQLNVFGVPRLRVIDASVMPSIVSSSTGAATMVIAEKGADLILKFWGETDRHQNMLRESKKVHDILKTNVDKLKAMDTSNAFFNSIKDTESFRRLNTASDQFKSGSGSTLNAFYGSNPLNAEVIKQESSIKYSNPLKLISDMFRSSLNLQTTTTTEAPVVLRYNMKPPPVQLNYAQDSKSLKSALSVSNIATKGTKAPKFNTNVDVLFEPPQSSTVSSFAPPGYVNYPFEEVTVSTSSPVDGQVSSTPTISTATYTLSPKPFSTSFSQNNQKSVGGDSTSNFPFGTFTSYANSILGKALPAFGKYSTNQNSQNAGKQFPVIHSFTSKILNKNTGEASNNLPAIRELIRRENPLGLKSHITELLRPTTVPAHTSTSTAITGSHKISQTDAQIFSKSIATPSHVSLPNKVNAILAPPSIHPQAFSNFQTFENSATTPIPENFQQYKKQEPTTLATSATTYLPFQSAQISKPHPESYYNYQAQMSSQNNTYEYNFIPQSTNTNAKPPSDYEFIVENPSKNQPNEPTPSTVPVQENPNYKIIYEMPNYEKSLVSIPANSANSENLASNVQDILHSINQENSKEGSSPLHIQTETPLNQLAPDLSNYYIIDDSKDLDTEIQKLLASKNLTAADSQVYVIMPQGNNNTNPASPAFSSVLSNSPFASSILANSPVSSELITQIQKSQSNNVVSHIPFHRNGYVPGGQILSEVPKPSKILQNNPSPSNVLRNYEISNTNPENFKNQLLSFQSVSSPESNSYVSLNKENEIPKGIANINTYHPSNIDNNKFLSNYKLQNYTVAVPTPTIKPKPQPSQQQFFREILPTTSSTEIDKHKFLWSTPKSIISPLVDDGRSFRIKILNQ